LEGYILDFIGAYTADNVSYLLKGFLMTLEVAFISIIISFLVGCLVAVVRYAKIPILAQLAAFYVETIRNLPLLLIIFFVYFALPEIGIKFSIMAAAIVALSVFESAMLAEIIRGGLNSIDKGQIEAGRSSGLSYIQTLWHIVLPQALRRMVPPTVGQFISLLKDTSLAVVIALPELMHNANIINGHKSTFVIPILMLAALFYFTVNYALSIFSKRLEVKHT
jgi:aspartate/glutamate/glutamine transport system permease protein